MCFNDEEIKFNCYQSTKFPANDVKYNAIESLGWDYCKEEPYHELFSTEEFFEEEDPSYILEEVNVMLGKTKFESLDLKTKGKKKIKSSIEEPPEIELKPLPNHLKYAYLGENDTLYIISHRRRKDVIEYVKTP